MKTPPLRAVLAAALTGSALIGGLAAGPASANFQNKTCNANPGCTSDGNDIWREVKTTKTTAGVAPMLCARLYSGGDSLIGAPCSTNVTYVRRCYYGTFSGYAWWSGTGSYTIYGRVANDADQQGC